MLEVALGVKRSWTGRDIKTLILWSRLLLARGIEIGLVQICGTYVMVEEVDVIKMKLRGQWMDMQI